MSREEDRFLRLPWLRHQELSQFRLFRMLRARRHGPGGRPRPPRGPDADPKEKR